MAAHMQMGRSALASLETDRSGIDAQRLAELGTTLDVDVIYVLTGMHARRAAGKTLDWQLVEAILKGLGRWAAKNHVTLQPAKTALALKILYDYFADNGTVDDQRLDEVMQLAA